MRRNSLLVGVLVMLGCAGGNGGNHGGDAGQGDSLPAADGGDTGPGDDSSPGDEAPAGDDLAPGDEAQVEGCDAVVCDPCAIYVDASAGSGGDGLSPAMPLDELPDAIDAAATAAGECCTCDVLVAEGTYYVYRESELDTVALRPRVNLIGGYPEGFAGARDPETYPTILDGHEGPEQAARVFHVVTGHDDTVLDGFTITGGHADAGDGSAFNPNNYGGGLLNLGVSPTIIGCRFEDNYAVNGGAIYNVASAAVIDTSVFSRNTASQGGGAVDNRNSTTQITRCTFADNSGDLGGAIHEGDAGASMVINSVFWRNTAATAGGALYADRSLPLIVHATCNANHAGSGGALAAENESSLRAINSIFWGDTPAEVWTDADSIATITHSDIDGCGDGSCTADPTGNIDTNPFFIEPTAGELHLWAMSPCLDVAGDTGALVAGITLDRDGRTRAYDGDGNGSDVADMGAYELTLRADEFRVIHVDAAARGANDGTSWADAFHDLHDALAAATPYTQLWVAEGTYVPSHIADRGASFVLQPGTAVYGGFSPAAGADSHATRDPVIFASVLSGDLGHNDDVDWRDDNSVVVLRSARYVILDGVTVRGGQGLSECGSGIQVSAGHSLWLSGCTVTGNHAFYGAGLCARDAYVGVQGSTFSENRAALDNGGAVFIGGTLGVVRIEETVFSDNNASYNGGAVAVDGADSAVEILGCDFSGNVSWVGLYGGGGGLWARGATVTIEGSSFAGNTARNGGGIYLDGATATVTGSTFTNNTAFDDQLFPNWDGCAYEKWEGVGGGIANIASSLTLTSSTFTGNVAQVNGNAPCNNGDMPAYYALGGGVFTWGGQRSPSEPMLSATTLMRDLVFEDNSALINGGGEYAGSGGAAAFRYSTFWVVNTLFRGNTANHTVGFGENHDASGGALFIDSFPKTDHETAPTPADAANGAAIVNCAFDSNIAWGGHGGGIYLTTGQSLRIFNSTFVGNAAYGSYGGGGVLVDYGKARVYNSIFWGNTGQVQRRSLTVPSLDCNPTNGGRWLFAYNSTIEDGCLAGCDCANVLTSDPVFETGTLYLSPSSPSRDAGDDTALQADWTDVDGDGDVAEVIPCDLDNNPRTVGTVDHGAYEVQ